MYALGKKNFWQKCSSKYDSKCDPKFFNDAIPLNGYLNYAGTFNFVFNLIFNL